MLCRYEQKLHIANSHSSRFTGLTVGTDFDPKELIFGKEEFEKWSETANKKKKLCEEAETPTTITTTTTTTTTTTGTPEDPDHDDYGGASPFDLREEQEKIRK